VRRPGAPTASRLLLLVLAAGAVAGCRADDRPEEPIGFYLSSRQDLLRARRAVFIELTGGGDATPELAREATDALSHAIQQRQLFHLDVVGRTDPMCRDLPLDRLEALSLEEMSAMRSSLGCDAVLFGRAWQFQPYPRMKIGLVLKLVNLKDGKLVWGVDHVWDTADRAIERRVRKYFGTEVRSGYDPLNYELVFTSPRAFLRYVAYEVARTLPELQAPGAAAADGRTPGPTKTVQTGQESLE